MATPLTPKVYYKDETLLQLFIGPTFYFFKLVALRGKTIFFSPLFDLIDLGILGYKILYLLFFNCGLIPYYSIIVSLDLVWDGSFSKDKTSILYF